MAGLDDHARRRRHRPVTQRWATLMTPTVSTLVAGRSGRVMRHPVAPSSPLDRRRFIGLSTGVLAAAAACRRPVARADLHNSTITIAYDPAYNGPFGWGLKSLLFLPLVRFSERGELEGRLAESWEHTSDFRSWTYRLRPGVRWHDGVPVTASDVKFTLELLARPESAQYLPFESIEVPDDRTVTVRSEHGIGYQTTAYCLPKHLLERLDPKNLVLWQEFWTHPVGNGPYRYLRQVPDVMAELTANPDHYRGKPQIGRVAVKYSARTGLIELLGGKVDVTSGNDVRSPLDKLDARFRVYWMYEGTTARGIYWQNQHPLFRDPRVRRALTLAINRRELLPLINVPGDVALVDGPYTERQLRRGELPVPIPFDPEQAGALLAAAGWQHREGDGARTRDGKPFQFTAILQSAPYPQIALYVQDQFRRVGIQMDLQPLDDSIVSERLQHGAFEAAVAKLPGDGWLLADDKAPLGYQNPAFFALFRRAKSTADPAEQDHLYRELTTIVRADAPVTFLCPKVDLQVTHRRVRGLESPWRSEPEGFMEDLWLDDGSG